MAVLRRKTALFSLYKGAVFIVVIAGCASAGGRRVKDSGPARYWDAVVSDAATPEESGTSKKQKDASPKDDATVITVIKGDAAVDPCARDFVVTDSLGMEAVSGCSKINGDLAISSSVITDLSRLTGLREVAGDLDIIDNSALTNFEGLSSLTSVGGGISIRNNPLLKSTKGLSSITTLRGSLVIGNNKSLTSLEGMTNLFSVGGLFIYKNASLKDVQGLAGIVSVLGTVMIEYNSSLATCLADALQKRLVAAGFSGTGLIRGNNDSGTCN
jgi:hypothetical protein